MDTILYTVQGNVAVIRFNRPDKFNAFNREMALALQAALDEAAANADVRCVLITADGKAFSSGQDITELLGDAAISMEKILVEHFNPIASRITAMEKPVVAAVNGVAAGAGANLALCCDIAVAAKSASFIQAFSKIGLVPDSGGTYFLPRLIGYQKAAALMMTGDKVWASEAERLGMIYKVFSDEEFAEESMKLVMQLAAMPTKGLALTKKILQESQANNFAQQLDAEDKYQRIAAATEDYNEGINAFVEKRKPVFKGK